MTTSEKPIIDTDGVRYGPCGINKIPPSKFFADAAALLTEAGAARRKEGRRILAHGPRTIGDLMVADLADLIRDAGCICGLCPACFSDSADCPCADTGFQAGLEADREPLGGRA